MRSARFAFTTSLVLLASSISASAYAACGDGKSSANEACDDGNNTAGDGCDASCRVEPDYVCSGSPSVCCSQAAASAYVVLGDATAETAQGMITLTPAQLWKSGTAWNRQALDFGQPFAIAVRLYLGNRDGTPNASTPDLGADGGALLFQRDPRALATLGTFTGAAGQESNELGARGIVPVVGVEFDTYNNGANYNDITTGDEDHTSVFHGATNPPINQLTPATCMNDGTTCSNFEDGLWHLFEVRWSGADHHLTVSFDGVQRIDLDHDLVGDYFGGDPKNILFGFAGSTGGYYNLQRLCPLAATGLVQMITDAGAPATTDAAVAPPADAASDAPADAGTSDPIDASGPAPSVDAAAVQVEVNSANAGPTPGDTDGDLVANEIDPAPNDPCVPNRNALACGSGDADGDHLTNAFECPGLRFCRDTDGDGVSDYADTDSDGDGIPDAKECPDMNACPDSNGDGIPDLLSPAVKPSSDGCALGSAQPTSALWLLLLMLSVRTGWCARSATARACGARRPLLWSRAARRRPRAAPRSS